MTRRDAGEAVCALVVLVVITVAFAGCVFAVAWCFGSVLVALGECFCK